MRRKMEHMQREVNEFMEYVKHELARGLGDWEQRLNTALVPSPRRRTWHRAGKTRARIKTPAARSRARR